MRETRRVRRRGEPAARRDLQLVKLVCAVEEAGAHLSVLDRHVLERGAAQRSNPAGSRCFAGRTGDRCLGFEEARVGDQIARKADAAALREPASRHRDLAPEEREGALAGEPPAVKHELRTAERAECPRDPCVGEGGNP